MKERIVEYLAVRKLKNDMKGPIICMVGPPGVGKTSLAKSVARALGRKMHRMSLGGVRDEAEIRGHRRTYIGSMPGKVIKGLKKAGTNNPVFVSTRSTSSAPIRGDPASALLEVLDPEQNDTFHDHYLDVDFDLSKVLFIATANQTHPIPAPLRDRMEMIEIPGYTMEDKVKIAQSYIIPEQLAEHGLNDGHCAFPTRASASCRVLHLEAGVRGLKWQAGLPRRGQGGRQRQPDRQGRVEPREGRGDPRPIKFFNEVAQRTSVPASPRGWRGRSRWRHPVHRGHQDAGKGQMRLTGSSDGMKESWASPQLRAPRPRTSASTTGSRQDGHPRPRPVRVHPQGWSRPA